MTKLKMTLAVSSFICSILFGVAAFLCPPLAIIDSSVLWFTSQLLVFTATLLGLSMSIDSVRQIARGGDNKRTEED